MTLCLHLLHILNRSTLVGKVKCNDRYREIDEKRIRGSLFTVGPVTARPICHESPIFLDNYHLWASLWLYGYDNNVSVISISMKPKATLHIVGLFVSYHSILTPFQPFSYLMRSTFFLFVAFKWSVNLIRFFSSHTSPYNE